MEIFNGASVPFRPADVNTFVGQARVQPLALSDQGTPVHVYRVEFGPDGRTNWHVHSGPQWLLVVEGRIRVQTSGQKAQDVKAGDAVLIPAGEKHWHGAVPGTRGTHLAVNIDFTTEWLDPVSDAEYAAR
jgi:quercetin dioxygenase-like cupin family protein